MVRRSGRLEKSREKSKSSEIKPADDKTSEQKSDRRALSDHKQSTSSKSHKHTHRHSKEDKQRKKSVENDSDDSGTEKKKSKKEHASKRKENAEKRKDAKVINDEKPDSENNIEEQEELPVSNDVNKVEVPEFRLCDVPLPNEDAPPLPKMSPARRRDSEPDQQQEQVETEEPKPVDEDGWKEDKSFWEEGTVQQSEDNKEDKTEEMKSEVETPERSDKPKLQRRRSSSHDMEESKEESEESPKEEPKRRSRTVSRESQPESGKESDSNVEKKEESPSRSPERMVEADSPKTQEEQCVSSPKSPENKDEGEVQAATPVKEQKVKSDGEISDGSRSRDSSRSRSRSSSRESKRSISKSPSPVRKYEKVSLKRPRSTAKLISPSKSEDSENRTDKDDTQPSIEGENKENMSLTENTDSTGQISPDKKNLIPRKRKWRSAGSAAKKPVLSISTASLKSLIPEARPVSPSELQLLEEGELVEGQDAETVDLPPMRPVVPAALPPEPPKQQQPAMREEPRGKIQRKISIVSDDAHGLQRTPSPPRNKMSNILQITNLVRPFTVNQLKELLARTGKIKEGGFWINNIKSVCFVEYETEDQAIETRHALHGVRWPVSNPKTLCVDFGSRENMNSHRSKSDIDSIPRKTEPLRIERSVNDWMDIPREHPVSAPEVSERRIHKQPPPVREWDLDKIVQMSPDEKDLRLERERRERERERERAKDKERKSRKERGRRSRSSTPHEVQARKSKKKEEDAPAKLLDDLFRKTKSTPCIYWLPLTQEQIAVKEEMRRKHMAEHERRRAELKKADKEREREREKQRFQRRNDRSRQRPTTNRRRSSTSPKK